MQAEQLSRMGAQCMAPGAAHSGGGGGGSVPPGGSRKQREAVSRKQGMGEACDPTCTMLRKAGMVSSQPRVLRPLRVGGGWVRGKVWG